MGGPTPVVRNIGGFGARERQVPYESGTIPTHDPSHPRARMAGVAGGYRTKLYRDDAVVLRWQKLGESDRIVTLFTRWHGRVRAVARGVRRTTSKFGARLEPFGHIDVQIAEGPVLCTRWPGRGHRSVWRPDLRRLSALHGGERHRRDGRAAHRDEPSRRLRLFLLTLGALRALAAASTPRRSCSTPICCGRWWWPDGRRR